MKKFLFASVAFVALIAAHAASAADMGLPVKGRMVEPEQNWSGFYAGLNAGYARSNTVWNDLDATLTAGGTFINQSASGFTGGGQIGYSWQVRHAVFGVETDFNYLGLNHGTNLFVLTGGTPTAIHDSLRWFGTVRGRAGLALDNVLMYLTAGLAYGRTDHKEIDGAPVLNADLSATKVGFTAGVGTEYGLDPHWSVKAEVLYVDLGKSSTTIGPFFGGISGRFDTLDTMWIVRAGVNYKLGGQISLGQPDRARSFPRKLKLQSRIERGSIRGRHFLPDIAKRYPGYLVPRLGGRSASPRYGLRRGDSAGSGLRLQPYHARGQPEARRHAILLEHRSGRPRKVADIDSLRRELV